MNYQQPMMRGSPEEIETASIDELRSLQLRRMR